MKEQPGQKSVTWRLLQPRFEPCCSRP